MVSTRDGNDVDEGQPARWLANTPAQWLAGRLGWWARSVQSDDMALFLVARQMPHSGW